jgi:hypothetical protein
MSYLRMSRSAVPISSGLSAEPLRWGRFFGGAASGIMSSAEAALRWRRTGIEKLGNGGDQLRWRERFGQKNTMRDAVRGPLIGCRAGHVNDGESGVDLSGLLGHSPTVDPAKKIDAGDKRPVVVPVSP